MLRRLSLAVLCATISAGQTRAQERPLKTDDQKTLYALGISLGNQVGQRLSILGLTATEVQTVELGLRDAVLNKKPRVNMEVFGPKIQTLAEGKMAAQAQKDKAIADKEKSKSKDFLQKAAKEKGAIKLPSGLVYTPIKAGSGASPKETDTVRVHYHGTFPDGKVFDSSVQRKEPAEFPLNGVIPCWTEGVQKLKEGGKAKLVCPSEIAYGDRGSPPVVPPGATLVFEVELLKILAAAPAK
ncbi:MAG: FKBP-type peptidyl-prolyl cis-trans isomerase [Elusimicrobia bacterium]|nr:FKBP-type peptidyl-prolyl cis-trans isomerase [Elusimicrobiota bacterium]